ncbi:MAG: short-chain dehydrogenase [Paracoccaceae bacterium]|nr:MAG: short-chain dehydrogenase [Paracoccaceae bacterium]
MSETWIILGASSAMARAFAREAARRGHALILAGRDVADLARDAADARLRGARAAEVLAWDATDPGTHRAVIDAIRATSGPIGVASFAGSMPDQAAIDGDPALIEAVMAANFTGIARMLHQLAPMIESRGGTVLGVGSVAGDRGRVGNYVYGAAKAALHAYLSGLRNRLRRHGAHVVTAKPGFVDTAMTWGQEGMFLVADPEDVARDLWRAIDRRRNIVYTPWFWWGIMAIIRLIPEPLFKRLSI